MKMEEQLTPSAPAPASIPPVMPTITPEMVEQMKARAREEAIRITMEQRQASPAPQLQLPTGFQRAPQIVYVRRNLTVAELILTILLACGIVFGVQLGWNFGSKLLPRIEIKVK